MSILIWSSISFLSSSVPWSLIIGLLFIKKDIRSVGDNNPGSTNVLKLGGLKPGLLAIVLDISKAFFPVFIAIKYFNIGSWSIMIVATFSLLGSIFSPFLKFKGGKSLAVSCGLWVAISSGMIIPLICLIMATANLIQKIHIWTILSGWIGILIWVILTGFKVEYLILWLINFIIVMMKHKGEFSQRVILREWLVKPEGRI